MLTIYKKNRTKNIFLGAFVIFSVGSLAAFLFFINPKIGDGKQRVFVRFTTINGITPGTQVLFAGSPVGEVGTIRTLPNNRQISGSEQVLYLYELGLHIDSKIQIYQSDLIVPQSLGLLGEKAIAIIPRPIPKDSVGVQVDEHSPMYGDSCDPLENTMQQLIHLGNTVESVLLTLSESMQQHSLSLGQTLDHLSQATSEVNAFTKTMNASHFIPKLTELLAYIQSICSDINVLSQSIARGNGTLGKICQEEDFYLHMDAILKKMDTLLSDINRYGLLFNLNKQWQKEKVKRVSDAAQPMLDKSISRRRNPKDTFCEVP